jgi:trans-aconitate methyltransferase
MTAIPRVTPTWLRLREPADATARASDLADLVSDLFRDPLSGARHLAIHDLGSGTGSMPRWLAPRLPGSQHWYLYDRDPDLLDHAVRDTAGTVSADGVPVGVEARERDITRLTPADLDGASLITAAALLDMFTAAELERVVAACAGTGCPALFTLSVTGRVEFTPSDPLDEAFAEAFNAHQRRTTGGRTLLGPDAAAACATAFRRHGVSVQVRPSPWLLGPDQAELTVEWLRGWVGAAVEQRPELAVPARDYIAGREGQARAGQLCVVLHHEDLLAGCS